MNEYQYALVSSGDQRKWPDYIILHLSVSWKVLRGSCFDGCRYFNFLSISVAFLAFPSFYHKLFRVCLCELFISSHSKESHIMCMFKCHIQFVFKLTNDGFCFPSARGSREWAALCLSACMLISSLLPYCPLPVLGKKSVGPEP